MSIGDGGLISSINGAGSPQFFVAPNATMESDDLGVNAFCRNAGGHVAGYVYRRCDEQTINIPKV